MKGVEMRRGRREGRKRVEATILLVAMGQWVPDVVVAEKWRVKRARIFLMFNVLASGETEGLLFHYVGIRFCNVL